MYDVLFFFIVVSVMWLDWPITEEIEDDEEEDEEEPEQGFNQLVEKGQSATQESVWYRINAIFYCCTHR